MIDISIKYSSIMQLAFTNSITANKNKTETCQRFITVKLITMRVTADLR